MLEHEKVVQLLGWQFAVGTHHDQESRSRQANFIQQGQGLQFLVGGFADRLKYAGQTVDQGLVDFGPWNAYCITLNSTRQVLGVSNKVTLLFAMQIPGLFFQLFQGGDKFIRFTIGRGQKFDNFAFG